MQRPPEVRLTNADKVLYPATQAVPADVTKADVFAYYTAIAEYMLPHISGRPATRKRWPNGVTGGAFFEKHLAPSAPKWLHRGVIEHQSVPTIYPIIDSVEALAWIAQQAALEVHVPQWRFVGESGPPQPGPATRLVFDLDPGEEVTMPRLAEVARALRELVDGIGLTALPLTSGGKGLHLYVPLAEPISTHGAATLAKRVAHELVVAMPELVTMTMTKSRRHGKVLVDWSQNSGAKTTVAPYSLRGRDQPTAAAPRHWAELDDPDLRQLRYDEVLARVAVDGDLLAELDPGPDRLSTYRSMRRQGKTPEPMPQRKPQPGPGNVFVIQEHHARRLHYDFRLERDGVLVSWAVPKNLPESVSVNHLAVRTEDHPLDYATFEGDIPPGEYGGGTVTIWDSGTYVAEKFIDTADKGEVIVTLSGSRISGRYALIRTDGKQWIAHRMKAPNPLVPNDFAPMLAAPGDIANLPAAQWAFEGKWDGYRLLVFAEHGRLRLVTRSGRDVTGEYPRLTAIAGALADHRVVLDGEAVVVDASGVPDFELMQNRGRGADVEFWAFDLLYLDGQSLLRVSYRDRRRLLETLAATVEDLAEFVVPALVSGDGAAAMAYSRERRWEGVVAKKWESVYQPGRRSPSWIKEKNWKTQDVVIGGWRAGTGGRTSGIGALLTGVPGPDGVAGGLRFTGRVGTGFTERALVELKELLTPLTVAESPFDTALSAQDRAGVTFVEPVLVGEVRYHDWTSDGHLRHPSWRGLRSDIAPDEVVRE